jgi:hypothetical protein
MGLKEDVLGLDRNEIDITVIGNFLST